MCIHFPSVEMTSTRVLRGSSAITLLPVDGPSLTLRRRAPTNIVAVALAGGDFSVSGAGEGVTSLAAGGSHLVAEADGTASSGPTWFIIAAIGGWGAPNQPAGAEASGAWGGNNGWLIGEDLGSQGPAGGC